VHCKSHEDLNSEVVQQKWVGLVVELPESVVIHTSAELEVLDEVTDIVIDLSLLGGADREVVWCLNLLFFFILGLNKIFDLSGVFVVSSDFNSLGESIDNLLRSNWVSGLGMEESGKEFKLVDTLLVIISNSFTSIFGLLNLGLELLDGCWVFLFVISLDLGDNRIFG
jgi:hypothetical protein